MLDGAPRFHIFDLSPLLDYAYGIQFQEGVRVVAAEKLVEIVRQADRQDTPFSKGVIVLVWHQNEPAVGPAVVLVSRLYPERMGRPVIAEYKRDIDREIDRLAELGQAGYRIMSHDETAQRVIGDLYWNLLLDELQVWFGARDRQGSEGGLHSTAREKS